MRITRTTILNSEPRVRVSWTAAENRVPMLEIPVKLVGVGEGIEDMENFDADRFVGALFD